MATRSYQIGDALRNLINNAASNYGNREAQKDIRMAGATDPLADYLNESLKGGTGAIQNMANLPAGLFGSGEVNLEAPQLDRGGDIFKRLASQNPEAQNPVALQGQQPRQADVPQVNGISDSDLSALLGGINYTPAGGLNTPNKEEVKLSNIVNGAPNTSSTVTNLMKGNGSPVGLNFKTKPDTSINPYDVPKPVRGEISTPGYTIGALLGVLGNAAAHGLDKNTNNSFDPMQYYDWMSKQKDQDYQDALRNMGIDIEKGKWNTTRGDTAWEKMFKENQLRIQAKEAEDKGWYYHNTNKTGEDWLGKLAAGAAIKKGVKQDDINEINNWADLNFAKEKGLSIQRVKDIATLGQANKLPDKESQSLYEDLSRLRANGVVDYIRRSNIGVTNDSSALASMLGYDNLGITGKKPE